MRVDTRTVLTDYEGNDILNPHQKDGKIEVIPLTLRDALITAINDASQLKTSDGEPMYNSMGQAVFEVFTAEMKGRSYQLSTKIYTSPEVDLTEDEVSYIKERIEKIWNSPLIRGKIFELLSPPTNN